MTPCTKYKGGVKGGVLALCRKPVICQSFETTHPFCGANVDITIIPGNSSVLKEHAQITAQLIDIFKDQESRCFVKTVKTYRNFFFKLLLTACSGTFLNFRLSSYCVLFLLSQVPPGI